ncbi:MAG: CHAT domain-containing tetratricopeptide repeat protein [Chloroflexota bacterium]|nr:CHAT domain-containing tetratricopeptide repeat protein [Chloroflexota bacterium]
MAPQDLVEQLLALPDVESQRRFLEDHASLLDDEVANALKAQADHFLRADSQSALQMANLLFHMAELSGDLEHRALGLRAEGNVRLFGLGEYQKAIELYDEAARIYQGQGCLVDQAKSQVGKLEALSQLGCYAEALEVGEWVSRILEDHAEWQVLAVLSMNLGNVHSRAGDDAGSLEMYNQAAMLCRQLEEKEEPPWLWLWVQQNRAIALRNLGRFEDSIRASQTAWEGLERLGQWVEAARARQNLAFTYFLLGRYNEALKHLDQARDVFLADGRQHDAMRVESFISDCLLQLRRFKDVLEKCRRVRSLFAELGTRRVVGYAIVNEAVAYAALGCYPEALDSLAEAHQIFEEEDNIAWIAATDMETAAVLLQKGRYDESLVVAQECITVFKAHGLPVEEAQACLVAARAVLALGQHDEALRLATEVLDIGETKNVPTLIYQGHQLLGALAAARGDPQEALAAFDRAIEAIERLRGRLMVEFRVGFLEDKEEIYQDAVGLCLDLNQPLRGLEYAERAKSRALLDLLAYRLDLSIQARSRRDESIIEELVCLRAERDRLYRRWESGAGSGQRGWTLLEGDRGRAQQQVLALEDRITDLWHRLLIRNADYAREAALWTVRAEPVQPYLALDSILVEFFITHGRLVVFLVTAGEVQARRLEGDLTRIQTLTQLLWLNLKAVSKSSPDRVSALAINARGILGRLNELLMAPLADELGSFRRLIIVPHGPLHYLPFHALHDGTSFLLERYEISYLPGASFLRYCREAQLANSGLFAIGHSFGGRLPHTLQEARAVATLFNGQVLLENQATLANVQQGVSDCRMLHVAAHGDFRADNPLFSGLALADGWLTTLDIFNLQLNASLVTLSACQTGRNVVAGGDELLGLMRAFLSAGAASLVLTSWVVEDRSTAQIMEAFYQKLAHGWTKGQALRHAQLQFLQGRGEQKGAGYSHPYFWAPFFLVGNAGPL